MLANEGYEPWVQPVDERPADADADPPMYATLTPPLRGDPRPDCARCEQLQQTIDQLLTENRELRSSLHALQASPEKLAEIKNWRDANGS